MTDRVSICGLFSSARTPLNNKMVTMGMKMARPIKDNLFDDMETS